MQVAYIKTLYDIMLNDTRAISLLSDSGTDYDLMMAAEMPNQCFNFGIAEQNKVAIAAGMAMKGYIPFVYTSGAFLVYRSYEFIRNDVCYQNQNVKIVGMGSGTSWRTLGPSHHTTEDIAAMRALPNLTILSPATPLEVAACTRAAYELQGPCYIRIGMSGETEYFEEGYQITIGKSVQMTDGKDIAIFSTGSILSEVMEAEKLLHDSGINASVINMYSIKPLDREAILRAAADHTRMVTVEEHNVIGGLGGAITEVLAETGATAKLKRIGLQDCFAKGYGTQKQVRQMNGLDACSLVKEILSFI